MKRKVLLLSVAAALVFASVAHAGGVLRLEKAEHYALLNFGGKMTSCEVYAPTREIECSVWDYAGGVWSRVVPPYSASGDTVETIMRGTAEDILKKYAAKGKVLCYRTLNTTQNDSTAIKVTWKE